MASGGDASGYQCSMRLSASAKTQQVPDYIAPHEAVTIDDDGNEVRTPMTWMDWPRNVTPEMDGDTETGRVFIECADNRDWWLASVLVKLEQIDGIDLILPGDLPIYQLQPGDDGETVSIESRALELTASATIKVELYDGGVYWTPVIAATEYAVSHRIDGGQWQQRISTGLQNWFKPSSVSSGQIEFAIVATTPSGEVWSQDTTV